MDEPLKGAQVEDYHKMATALLEANRAQLSTVAEIVWKRHEREIPPIVRSLSGMDALLADLEKSSFLHGAIAALYTISEAIQRAAVPTVPVSPAEAKVEG